MFARRLGVQLLLLCFSSGALAGQSGSGEVVGAHEGEANIQWQVGARAEPPPEPTPAANTELSAGTCPSLDWTPSAPMADDDTPLLWVRHGETGALRSFRARGPVAPPLRPAIPGKYAAREPLCSVGDEDIEEVSDPGAYPYSSAVKLLLYYPSSRGYYGCSGVLIGGNVVVTAGHCVYSLERGESAEAIEVVPGMDGDTRPFGTAEAVDWAWYDEWSDPSDSDYRYDQAYVFLDRNLGDHAGALGSTYYDSASELYGVGLNMSHYPGEPLGDGTTMYRGYDEVVGYDDSLFYHEVDTAGGSSGGGLYRYYSSSQERLVVGNHSYAQEDHDDVCLYNGGVRFTSAFWDTLWDLAYEVGSPEDLPDLSDAGTGDFVVSVPDTSGPFDVRLTVNNMGTEESGAFEIDFYVSLSSTISTDDYFVTTGSGSSLEPFDAASGTVELWIPDEVPTGTFYLGWILDPDDDIEEFDESNNTGRTQSRIYVDRDLDDDGYDAGGPNDEDCDDQDPEINPDAREACDGVDNDCDGEIDEVGCDPDDGDAADEDPPGAPASQRGCGRSRRCDAGAGGPVGGLALLLALLGVAGVRRPASLRGAADVVHPNGR